MVYVPIILLQSDMRAYGKTTTTGAKSGREQTDDVHIFALLVTSHVYCTKLTQRPPVFKSNKDTRHARMYGGERAYWLFGAGALMGGVMGTAPSTTLRPFMSSRLIKSSACPPFCSSADSDSGVLIFVISPTNEVPQYAAEYLVTYYGEL